MGAFQGHGFTTPFTSMTVTRVLPGHVQATMTVTHNLTNSFGTLHGGATGVFNDDLSIMFAIISLSATLVDVLGTMALLADDPLRPGVSVDINVTYIAAANTGDELILEGRCDQIAACCHQGDDRIDSVLKTGKRLGFTQVTIKV